jgi:hypothetical protein
MAYVKPGVEVTQTQVRVSPSLIAPDLGTVIIGKPFFVEEVGDFSYADVYSGVQVDVDYAGLPSGAEVHTASVYVDLIGGTGASSGTRLHLDPATDFTAGSASVQINASLGATYPAISGLESDAAIEVGYRALRTDLDPFLTMSTLTDIEDKIGSVNSVNPLGVGLHKAMLNTSGYTYALIVNEDTPLETSNEFTSADVPFDTLKTREIYAMVPLTTTAGVITACKTHATTYSAPEEKHERMVVAAPSIPWKDAGGGSTTADLADTAVTAGAIKEAAYGHQERRLVYAFPDTMFVTEQRHVSTLTDTYRDAVQGVAGIPFYLGENKTLTVNSVKYSYKKGDLITAAMLSNLAIDNTFLIVESPVPGYIGAAAIGGMISGFPPEAPFTNLAVTGVSRLKYSMDKFTESDLNTMAEGGNYLLVQSSETAPIYCRHQLTTDMTSVERRELSILKTLDFVAKFMRNGLSGYIGRYNISPQFLKLLTMTLQAQILYLVKNGHVNDIKILNIVQAEEAADTIEVSLDVLVKYPVNYIKIELQF